MPLSARAASIGLLATAAAVAGTVVAPSATASVPRMALRAVSGSALSVSVSERGATGYQLYASPTKSSVFVANLGHARTSGRSRSGVLTVAGLGYTRAPYWYRVKIFRGSSYHYTAVASVALRPPAPASVAARGGGAGGVWLTWRSENADGFVITQAGNAAMTAGVRNYTIRGAGWQFTPDGLVSGAAYYFRMRAFNGATLSAYSPVVRAVPATNQQPVRVMSYNVLEATLDGRPLGDGVVAPWSQRQVAVARLIQQAAPDVVAVQEAAAWTGAVRGPRMIDSLAGALGGGYALARTEIPPSEPHYQRTANYLLYKASAYEAAGAGGHWDLGYGNWASYQLLRNQLSGARFLAVSAHLTPLAYRAGDVQRQAQTVSLLAQAGAAARAAGDVPVIYAGDFNSTVNSNHAFDGSGVAMRAVGAEDAQDMAQVRVNAQYNSANLYLRTPPAYGQSIDHIYAPAGVAVRSWSLLLDLARGRFAGVIPSDHNPLVCDLSYPY
jgi:endonuclease/exonuclease/phosphatase family metal-dependent hydrolase